MKLPSDAIIAIEKMTNYLLQWRPENDKSQFLAQAGDTEQHADRLARDIRRQLLTIEAQFEETTEYGEMLASSIRSSVPTDECCELRASG